MRIMKISFNSDSNHFWPIKVIQFTIHQKGALHFLLNRSTEPPRSKVVIQISCMKATIAMSRSLYYIRNIRLELGLLLLDNTLWLIVYRTYEEGRILEKERES